MCRSVPRLGVVCLLLLLPVCETATGESPYAPTWESLKKHPAPEWFRDAKFGIYFHWGVYSVPAHGNEWYSRNMYIPGRKEHKHHVETYGPVSTFGYKDFIPRFTAEKFDADAWAELFREAGARFAGPVGEHADGFAMWESRVSRWNAAQMGPKRDIVGELAKAIRKRKMKFIVTLHHQWLWGWYPTTEASADASDPALADLYGPPVPPSGFARNDPKRSADFCRTWEDKIREVIDRYQPDLLWFDSRMGMVDESYRKSFLAYYYNQAASWGREVAVTYKNKDLPPGAGIVDLERGRMAKSTPYPWLNDDSICWKSWCHIQDPDYKSTDRLVDGLVDIVSKNGNLLLNIPPRSDGVIPQPVRQRLREMGEWLRVNGEAIYGTRPFKVFGEGPTEVKEGHFGERHIKEFTAQDVRFTTRGNVLYAIVLAWPREETTVKTLAKSCPLAGGTVSAVSLLGCDEKLTWVQNEGGLTVTMPGRKPCKHAFVLRIDGLTGLQPSGTAR